MHRSRAAAAERERELLAQLHELLFPSSAPAQSGGGGGALWSSSSSGLNVAEHCLFDESSPPSPVKAAAAAPCRRRRGSKRAREDDEQDKDKHGDGAEARCSNKTRRKTKQGTRTLVTTVPDFDGYQWRKYGQKQIEAAKYTRSYYRCTNSADQGCPAKRTVQRNDDGGDDDDNGGGPPKYTVVYISEHTCKATESAPPVILETTVVRTKNPPADHDAAAHVMLSSPDVAAVIVPAESAITASTGTASPAISDITWSGGGDTNPNEYGDYSHVFAADDWDVTTTTTAQAAAVALLQEMDFAGPIRSPVHDVAADCLIDADLFFDEPISTIPRSSSISSYHFFGF